MATATKKETTPPGASGKRRGIRLTRPEDVRRLLQRGKNETLKDELTTDKLRAISYAAQTILKVFELTALELRLTKIEALLMERRNRE